MRKRNILPFSIALVLVLVAFSALSISSVAENNRWTLASINPWNGVEAVAYVISYFSRTGLWTTYAITLGLASVLWFGVYMLITTLFKRRKED